MRNVLMVSWPFYPSGSIAAHRSGKFVKYLRDFGWEPMVLTLKKKHCNLRDETLCSQIPSRVIVIRTGYLGIENLRPLLLGLKLRVMSARNKKKLLRQKYKVNPAPESWFDLPRGIAWLPFGLVRAVNHAKKCDIIWATSPPSGGLCLGALLSKLTQKPFVADLRDLWKYEDAEPYPTKIHKKINQYWEKFVFNTAKLIVVTTPEAKEFYKYKHPNHASKIDVISNGYDPDEFLQHRQSKPPQEKGQLSIGYFGSLYQGRQGYMLELMQSVKKIAESKPDRKIKVYLRGRKPERARDLSSIAQTSDLIDISGPIPHKDVLKMMQKMDVLVLIGSPKHSQALPGKLFEYIGAEKPILAITSPSAISRFMKHYKIGISVNPFKNQKIEPALRKLIDDCDFYIKQIKAIAPQFTRREMTRKLAEAFDNIYGENLGDG